MWAEAVLAKEDLAKAIAELCPLKVQLGNDGTISIVEPRDVELVPDVGLRVTVTVEIHWPVMGIQIPVSIRAAIVELRPEIDETATGSALMFRAHLDCVDISALPAFVDRGIVDLVNNELETKKAELAFHFTRVLSHAFALPDALVTAGKLDLRAKKGRVKITSDALALAVLFEAQLERHDEGEARAPVVKSADDAPPPPVLPPPPRAASLSGLARELAASPVRLAAAAAIVALAGVGVFSLVAGSRR